MRRRTLLVLASMAAVLAALVVVSVSAAAHPAGAASFNLYAGRSADAGDVFVWNDGTNLYVEIDLADGWCMTESHVAAAATLAGIPQVNGNPPPGQFAYGDTYSPCESGGDTFTIPLAGLGANPVVAVHAKVWGGETCSTIVSNAGDSIVKSLAYPVVGSPVPAVVTPGYAGWPAISGASYISDQVAGDPFDTNVWRKVTETLAVPGLPISGELWVNSDNYERTKLNGTEIERDDASPTSTVENTAPEVAVTPQSWATITNVPFTPVAGANSFEFVFRNVTWEGGGSFVDNPSGLSYKATACYYARTESAWAGTMPFPGKNWAVYFTYTVRHGVMSNQDGYGAEFSAFGDTGHLKFYAVAGTSGTLGDLDWKYGNPSSPTFAFSGLITSAMKNAGVWELVTDITQVTAAGGTTITDACTITFYVQDGTPDQVGGWMWWSAPPTCNYGTATGPYPLSYGSINEF